MECLHQQSHTNRHEYTSCMNFLLYINSSIPFTDVHRSRRCSLLSFSHINNALPTSEGSDYMYMYVIRTTSVSHAVLCVPTTGSCLFTLSGLESIPHISFVSHGGVSYITTTGWSNWWTVNKLPTELAIQYLFTHCLNCVNSDIQCSGRWMNTQCGSFGKQQLGFIIANYMCNSTMPVTSFVHQK